MSDCDDISLPSAVDSDVEDEGHVPAPGPALAPGDQVAFMEVFSNPRIAVYCNELAVDRPICGLGNWLGLASRKCPASTPSYDHLAAARGDHAEPTLHSVFAGSGLNGEPKERSGKMGKAL